MCVKLRYEQTRLTQTLAQRNQRLAHMNSTTTNSNRITNPIHSTRRRLETTTTNPSATAIPLTAAIWPTNLFARFAATVMSPEEVRRSQKPYRYGMILLCFGALINWVGLAENYTEPIRYAGVACIVCGALLICTAMCCWLHTPPRSAVGASEVTICQVGSSTGRRTAAAGRRT